MLEPHMTPTAWVILTLCIVWFTARLWVVKNSAKRREEHEQRMAALLEEQERLLEAEHAERDFRDGRVDRKRACSDCRAMNAATARACAQCGAKL